jgi:hypothetical protein
MKILKFRTKENNKYNIRVNIHYKLLEMPILLRSVLWDLIYSSTEPLTTNIRAEMVVYQLGKK